MEETEQHFLGLSPRNCKATWQHVQSRNVIDGCRALFLRMSGIRTRAAAGDDRSITSCDLLRPPILFICLGQAFCKESRLALTCMQACPFGNVVRGYGEKMRNEQSIFSAANGRDDYGQAQRVLLKKINVTCRATRFSFSSSSSARSSAISLLEAAHQEKQPLAPQSTCTHQHKGATLLLTSGRCCSAKKKDKINELTSRDSPLHSHYRIAMCMQWKHCMHIRVELSLLD